MCWASFIIHDWADGLGIGRMAWEGSRQRRTVAAPSGLRLACTAIHVLHIGPLAIYSDPTRINHSYRSLIELVITRRCKFRRHVTMSAVLREKLGDGGVALDLSVEERRGTVAVDGIDVCLHLQQLLDAL